MGHNSENYGGKNLEAERSGEKLRINIENIFGGKTRGKFGGKSLRAMGENLWAKLGGK